MADENVTVTVGDASPPDTVDPQISQAQRAASDAQMATMEAEAAASSAASAATDAIAASVAAAALADAAAAQTLADAYARISVAETRAEEAWNRTNSLQATLAEIQSRLDQMMAGPLLTLPASEAEAEAVAEIVEPAVDVVENPAAPTVRRRTIRVL